MIECGDGMRIIREWECASNKDRFEREILESIFFPYLFLFQDNIYFGMW